MLNPYGCAGARTMRTAAEQAQIFLLRAQEIEERAKAETDGQLQATLFGLAEYYRQLALQNEPRRPPSPKRVR